MPWPFFGTIALAGTLIACGQVVPESEKASPDAVPTAVFLETADGCASAQPVEAVHDALQLNVEQGVNEYAVVEIFYGEELCTGLGGQYVLAREIDGTRKFALGGHGCQFYASERVGGTQAFGVVSFGHVALVHEIPPSACVAHANDASEPFSYDTQSRAAAVFSSRADAQAFADSIR